MSLLVLMGLCSFSIFPLVSTAANIILVQDGKPKSVIVLPNEAGYRSVEQAAAEMLVKHIERMSGIRLTIKREHELKAAHVKGQRVESRMSKDMKIGYENISGKTLLNSNKPSNFVLIGQGELVAQLGVNADDLGPGGIRLKTMENAVILLGGPTRLQGEPGSDDRGLQYATIELLEQLGWRYLWPGKSGWVIPKGDSVKVGSLDISYTPLIRSRGIRAYQDLTRLYPRSLSGLKRLGITHQEWKIGRAKGRDEQLDHRHGTWSRWQRLGGKMLKFGHAGGGLRNWEKHHKEHRAWFALQADNTRDQRGQSRFRLCQSNLDLIEHVANDIIQQKNENPNLALVSLDPNDGSRVSWCLCPACRALDPSHGPKINLKIFERAGSPKRERKAYVSLTDRLVYYWNSIAERVTKVHPDLLFGVSAYSTHSHPPVERKLHPNLVVRFVTHVDHLEGWKKAGMRRVYWRPNTLLAGRRDGKLRSYVGRLSTEFRTFAEAGVVQTDFDSIKHHWAIHGINYFAAARLAWNPYLTAKEIIADFASTGFDQGARYIEKYFWRVEELTSTGIESRFNSAQDYRYTPKVVAELRALLNAAEAEAADLTVSRRIAFLRIGLNFTELQETLAWMSWQASKGKDYDQQLARWLIDLNSLIFRDIIHNHSWAINIPSMIWKSGTLAMYSPIGGRTVMPSNQVMLKRIGNPHYGLTGREDSLEEMLNAFGL